MPLRRCFERGFPACLQVSGDETILRLDRLVLTLGAVGFIRWRGPGSAAVASPAGDVVGSYAQWHSS